MPTDALGNACSLRSGPHNLTHERVLPVRLLPAHLLPESRSRLACQLLHRLLAFRLGALHAGRSGRPSRREPETFHELVRLRVEPRVLTSPRACYGWE